MRAHTPLSPRPWAACASWRNSPNDGVRMKRFRFPLERVRRWRSEQANLEELKLEQLRAEAARLAGARLEVEAEAVRSAREVLAQSSIDALELTSLESYRQHLRRRAYELENLERQSEA